MTPRPDPWQMIERNRERRARQLEKQADALKGTPSEEFYREQAAQARKTGGAR